MRIIKFDSNGHNAPAYGCNQPGDNSGSYVPLSDVTEMLRIIRGVHDYGEVFFENEKEFAAIADVLGLNSP